jgi:hypothetical protein
MNTSGLQTTIPQVVQTTSAVRDNSLTTLVFTFPTATTIGNTLVIGVQSLATGTVGTVSAVTIGASADHWGVVTGCSSAGNENMAVWCDPTSAASSTTITVTFAGATGLAILEGYAYEISGCSGVTTAAAAVDFGGNANSNNANVMTLTTTAAASTQRNDMFIGFTGTNTTAAATPVLSTTTIVPSLTALTQINDTPALGITASMISHWGLSGPQGTQIKYTGTNSQPGTMAVAVVALLPTTTPAAPVAIPFTVAIDGHTWDAQATVAGVGFTYDLVRPMALNNGNNVQVFWSLAATLYASSADVFDMTAWFRYDPTR